MEETAISQFLRDTLINAAGVVALVSGRVYEEEAPGVKVRPYVLYRLQAPNADRVGFGSRNRLLARGLWLVKGITEGNTFTTGDALASAIDTALNAAEGLVTIDEQDYRVFRIRRSTAVRYLEHPAGQTSGTRYNHVGGLYRVQCCKR